MVIFLTDQGGLDYWVRFRHVVLYTPVHWVLSAIQISRVPTFWEEVYISTIGHIAETFKHVCIIEVSTFQEFTRYGSIVLVLHRLHIHDIIPSLEQVM